MGINFWIRRKLQKTISKTDIKLIEIMSVILTKLKIVWFELTSDRKKKYFSVYVNIWFQL